MSDDFLNNLLFIGFLIIVLVLFSHVWYKIIRTDHRKRKNPMTHPHIFLRDFLGMTLLAWAGYALLVVT